MALSPSQIRQGKAERLRLATLVPSRIWQAFLPVWNHHVPEAPLVLIQRSTLTFNILSCLCDHKILNTHMPISHDGTEIELAQGDQPRSAVWYTELAIDSSPSSLPPPLSRSISDNRGLRLLLSYSCRATRFSTRIQPLLHRLDTALCSDRH